MPQSGDFSDGHVETLPDLYGKFIITVTTKEVSTRIRIYLFRHGQTDWNREGRIQGHLDVPLNDRGREQARSLTRHLERLQVGAILSSDLIRASETAQIAAMPVGIPVHTDSRLREIHLGQLQGMTRSEIESKFGIEFSNKLSHAPLTDSDIAMLGSESGEQVVARAFAAIRAFMKQSEWTTFAVATHGGVVRRLIQSALGDNAFPSPIPNGVLYPIDYRPDTDQFSFAPLIPIA